MAYNGRERIYNSELPKRALTKEEFLILFNDTLLVHERNRREINYLYNYYRGIQPILTRSDKKVRPEIDNRIVENNAKMIADFKIGYIWGEPIQLVRNNNKASIEEGSEDEIKKKDIQVSLINEYLQECDKIKKDKECGFWTAICGVGYMCILPSKPTSEIPISLYTLDPRCTYIVYNSGFDGRPLLAITYNYARDAITNTEVYSITAYGEDYNYVVTYDRTNNTIPTFQVSNNLIGMIPIVEFNLNTVRQGSFEHVLPLCDAINLLGSDRINDVSQAVQWFMKFVNVDIDDEIYERFKAKGVIVVKGEPGNPASVEVVSTALNQSEIQVLKTDMISRLHKLCNVPENTADPRDNTGQALIIGQGWAGAEADALSVENEQRGQQKELLKIAIKICELNPKAPEILTGIKATEVDIKYTRNRTDNLLVKTQGLKNMLDSGVAPILAFTLCGLFSDPQKAFELSRDYIDKYYDSRDGNNKEEFSGGVEPGNEFNQSEQLQKEFDKRENSI